MTAAVFCGKEPVAAHIKYSDSDICHPRLKFCKETIEDITACTSDLKMKPSLISMLAYIKSILL